MPNGDRPFWMSAIALIVSFLALATSAFFGWRANSLSEERLELTRAALRPEVVISLEKDPYEPADLWERYSGHFTMSGFAQYVRIRQEEYFLRQDDGLWSAVTFGFGGGAYVSDVDGERYTVRLLREPGQDDMAAWLTSMTGVRHEAVTYLVVSYVDAERQARDDWFSIEWPAEFHGELPPVDPAVMTVVDRSAVHHYQGGRMILATADWDPESGREWICPDTLQALLDEAEPSFASFSPPPESGLPRLMFSDAPVNRAFEPTELWASRCEGSG